MKKTLWILLVLVEMFFITAFLRAQGPVAAYGFNENTGTTTADASGNNNTGNVGAATWTTSGKFGAALQFNGTNAKVVINNSTSLQLNLKMTLEAWVYPTIINANYRDVIVKGGENYYLSASSQPNSMAGGGSHLANGAWLDVLSTNPLPVNTWSHICVTADGSTVRFWVNGVQTSAKLQPAPLGTSTLALEIGGDAKFGQYFTGRIDEVRIYNLALTQAEIQADMNTPVAPVSTITITDKHPDDTIILQWDYDPAFTSQVNGFGLYASATPTGPWQFYDGVPDPIQRTFAFVAPDRSTYFTMNACKQTASNNGFCSVFSNIVKINCIPLSEQFLWQFFTTRPCQ